MEHTKVLTVGSAQVAEVVVGRLRAAGIDAIRETHASYAEEPTSGSEGSVDILVPTADLEDARRVLAAEADGS